MSLQVGSGDSVIYAFPYFLSFVLFYFICLVHTVKTISQMTNLDLFLIVGPRLTITFHSELSDFFFGL